MMKIPGATRQNDGAQNGDFSRGKPIALSVDILQSNTREGSVFFFAGPDVERI
jgi:hypothetical protein